MKKLFTIIAFCIVNIVVLQAQGNKPTKEETIAFMEKVLKGGIGMTHDWGYIIQEVRFDGNNLYIYAPDENGGFSAYNYSNLPWEYLNTDTFETTNGNCNFGIHFSKNYKSTKKYKDYPDYSEFVQVLNVSIPQDKIESFKKACIHLSQIAKEENKDPFANQ